jgi:hypothetical protein
VQLLLVPERGSCSAQKDRCLTECSLYDPALRLVHGCSKVFPKHSDLTIVAKRRAHDLRTTSTCIRLNLVRKGESRRGPARPDRGQLSGGDIGLAQCQLRVASIAVADQRLLTAKSCRSPSCFPAGTRSMYGTRGRNIATVNRGLPAPVWIGPRGLCLDAQRRANCCSRPVPSRLTID